MNEAHRQFLTSPDWARMLETDLVPWLSTVGDLGDDVLEIGPGPGLTTDILRARVTRVTAVEIDESLAVALAARLAETNVDVLHADASASGLPSDRFSAAVCFSMFHHVPSPETQDKVLSEISRMLRPGGMFAATDSIDNEAIRSFHVDDVFVPLDPTTLDTRLVAAGFSDISIEVGDYEIRFHGRASPRPFAAPPPNFEAEPR